MHRVLFVYIHYSLYIINVSAVQVKIGIAHSILNCLGTDANVTVLMEDIVIRLCLVQKDRIESIEITQAPNQRKCYSLSVGLTIL